MKLKEMRPIGIVRKLGKDGRICLPAEIREVMDIEANDLVEQTLYKQENGEYIVVIRKYKGD
jgi:AbrB family looped-hinge helix DNA binding protein